jgi:hypothetical protein
MEIQETRPAAPDIALIALAALLLVLDIVSAIVTGWWASDPLLNVVYFLGVVGFLVAGAVSYRVPGQAANARLLVAIAAVSLIVDLLSTWVDVGPDAFLYGLVYWVPVALLAHLLLRWPGNRLQTRPQRLLLWVPYAVLPALALLFQVTSDKAWFGKGAANWWWLTLAPDENLSNGIFTAQQIVFVAFLVAVLVLIGMRLAAASPAGRRALVPIAIAAAFLGLATGIGAVQGAIGADAIDLRLVQNLALLTVPLAVLVGLAMLPRQPRADEVEVVDPVPAPRDRVRPHA